MANYGKYYIAVRLLLLKQYLEANAGRNRIVKRRELEQLLAEHDMPVEKKTLYADFAALGDICGLQLDYDPHKKGYRLLNPPFEPYELRLLVDSVQSSKFITREKAREITAKLKKLASDTHFEVLEMMKHSQTSFRDVPQVFILVLFFDIAKPHPLLLSKDAVSHLVKCHCSGKANPA